MTPSRFQTIEEIFLAALEREPDQLSAFLDTACEGDAVLRREVETLLASDQRAGPFIEGSTIGLATKIIGNRQADSLVGQTIGHYKISESIGTGGMGEVYLATDIVAGRKAALKLLPLRFTGDAARLKRFQQEAHAVVGLNHPNVLTVYEIGEDNSIHYIASELIEGETLRERLTRGPMQLNEAVEVAIQVASALAAAHQAGIVHRDIKPENIMLRPDGYAKVLDFGIVKLAEQELPTTVSKDEALFLVETNLGSVLGTVRYMSPEQARGAHVDKSTDIWSLGVVLYEMVTGHAPFSGDTPKEVMSSILEKEPPPLTRSVARAPSELQQIVSKMLRKDRGQRYRSAHELLEALKRLRHNLEVEAELGRSSAARSWLHRKPTFAALLLLLVVVLTLALPFYWHRNLPTSLPPEKSVAVLPFENLSRDPDNAYFADGIQEEILTRLTQVADLKVISRSSTQRYQSKPRNLAEIAKQLGVVNILEGSVQKAADQVRVNVQLVNAQTDSHIWADTYERKLTDILAVESEIAKGIAESLQAKLTGREEQALAVKPTNNPEAYDAYLRGLAFDARSVHTAYSPDLLAKAAGFFERAVELDPKFALAWARVSRVNAHLYFEGTLEATSARRDAAKRALEKAQKLEPRSPETVLALGYYQYWVLRDYGAAKTAFGRVSKMLPNSSEVRMALGRVARREGHWDESVAYLEQALALDPRNVEWLLDLAETYGLVRQFSAALKLYDQVLDISPNDPDVMTVKASIYQAQGNLQGAAKLLSEIDGPTPSDATFVRKITQLRFERNYDEAVRRLQARLAQFHYDSDISRSGDQVMLALMQRVAGDWAGAKVTAKQSRDILERLYRDESHMPRGRAELAAVLSQAYAVMGEKDPALKIAAHAITLLPRAKDPKLGPGLEENLALIQTMLGENGQAISTLARLLQTSYNSPLYGPPAITPAHLRLDPLWDPIRNDPRFEKILEESKNPGTLTTTSPSQKSIAVLPFENASNDPNSEYLSEGISEALINCLSELQQLRVIARPTAFHYKRKDVDRRQVGRELGVAAVLTGKVRQMQDALNVQVDLVDPVTGAEIWGAGYDRKITDLVAVKQAIAQEVTAKLKLKLSREDQRRLVKRDSTNAEAYQFYLRGRYFWNKRTSDGIKQAIEHFQQSIERDPNFALGYVGLADSYTGLAFYNFAAPHEAMPKAKESAIKALALDDTLAEAHATLAHILINYDWNSPAAEKEFKRSIELNPEYATAHQWYAIHYLTATGRLEEAVQEMKKALELEPASLVMNTFMGATLYYAGRYDEAIDQCRRTIQMDPNFAVAHWHLGLVYEQKQLLDAATEEFKKAISLSGGSPLMQAALGRAYAKSQKKHEANEMLNELNELAKRQYASAYELATIYVALGNNEEAFQLLAKAYVEHSFHLVNLNMSPQFKSVRSDPRFQDLVRRIGLSARATAVTEKSIAVLPFENLSKDEENAFFAGGMQDEILSDLAKIADLKVISRTSVMQYKSGLERNLREIAKVLGVSHVVEGSVQRTGERVRVSAQLIDARNDTHLWAEHYDRNVADVFAVQTEIAQQIADQLKANLSPGEKAAIAERPTADLVAYAYYTKGKEIDIYGNWEAGENEKKANQKVELLEKATQRDPNFALAYCELAKAQLDIENFELAKKAAETALQMRPDLVEPHLALARYYWLAPDSNIGVSREVAYDRARDELAIVRRMSPNNVEALLIDATIGRHQNRWDASLANLQKASELDPRNGEVAFRLEQIYFEMRRYSELERFIRKQAPPRAALEDPFSWLPQVKLAQGDPGAAQSLLEQVPPEYSAGGWIWDPRFKTALYTRDYDAANRVIATIPAKYADDAFGGPSDWAEGQIARARGDKQKALAAFAAARKKVEAKFGDKPEDVDYLTEVATLDAGLGRKAEAIREALHAVDLLPITKDSLNGPGNIAILALVYAWTGEGDRALEQLEKIAIIPGNPLTPTYGDLLLNPCWDDLRGDKRFDKIVAAAKAASK